MDQLSGVLSFVLHSFSKLQEALENKTRRIDPSFDEVTMQTPTQSSIETFFEHV